MKTFALALAATLLSGVSATHPPRFDYDATPTGSNKCALINVIMDESGSMSGDQNFMKNIVLPRLGTTLLSATYGYNDVFLCSAGFGGYQNTDSSYYRHLGCTRITSDGTTGTIVDSSVVQWNSYGATEDGWNAIREGMEDVYATIDSTELLSHCGRIDKNMVLVSDEDRDCTTHINKSWLKWKIYDNGYILNVVVDICIGNNSGPTTCRGYDAPNAAKFGMKISGAGGDAIIFEQDTSSSYSYSTTEVLGTYYDSYVWHDAGTADHYSDLVIDEPGAVWNINSMRCTYPGIPEAFADAFVKVKADEISDGCGSRCEGGGNGDPHFKTWKNEHFEFHGQCDLLLAKDPEFADGLGFDIQIRTKLVRFWSYISSTAIRIGSDILEIQGGFEQGAKYWMNLERNGPLTTIGGFPIKITDEDKGSAGIQRVAYEIDLSSKYPDQKIVIKTFKEFVNVHVEGASYGSFGNAVGMLGDFRTGQTLARDGVTALNDFSEYGQEWQLLPSDEMLFHTTEEPQFPQKCILPEEARGERRRRRLDESRISGEDAEKACSKLRDPLDRKDCVYDILATQDMDMVGAY